MPRRTRRIYGRIAAPVSDGSGLARSYDPTRFDWDAFELQSKTKISVSCRSAIFAAFMAGALLIESEQSLLPAPKIEKLLRKIRRRSCVEELIVEKAADPAFELLISLFDTRMGQPGAFVEAVLAGRWSEIEMASISIEEELSKTEPLARGIAWRATVCAVAAAIETDPYRAFRPSSRCDGRCCTIFVDLIDQLQKELIPKAWRRGEHSSAALSREVARALKGRAGFYETLYVT